VYLIALGKGGAASGNIAGPFPLSAFPLHHINILLPHWALGISAADTTILNNVHTS
jgi:hypothetical protein